MTQNENMDLIKSLILLNSELCKKDLMELIDETKHEISESKVEQMKIIARKIQSKKIATFDFSNVKNFIHSVSSFCNTYQ